MNVIEKSLFTHLKEGKPGFLGDIATIESKRIGIVYAEYWESFFKIIDDLDALDYVVVKVLSQGPHISRGINFDKWEKRFMPENNNKSISIGTINSHNVQVGDNNSIVIEEGINALIEAINSSSSSDAEKNDARGKLRQLLDNPIIASVAGGITTATIASLM